MAITDVPPKDKKGKVIPVSGIIPVIEAILMATWANIHPKAPARNSFRNMFSV